MYVGAISQAGANIYLAAGSGVMKPVGPQPFVNLITGAAAGVLIHLWQSLKQIEKNLPTPTKIPFKNIVTKSHKLLLEAFDSMK